MALLDPSQFPGFSAQPQSLLEAIQSYSNNLLNIDTSNPMGIATQPQSGMGGFSLGQIPGMSAGVGTAAGAAPAGGGFMKGLIGTKEAPGWGGLALGAAQGLSDAYTGMQQLALAKKTLAANKEQFALNFGAQQRTTNAALEDRQRARVASNSGAYQSVGDYMNQNRI